MPISIASAAIYLSVALFCGALIGSERQVRRHTAGLRTNALVALGAAIFVVSAALYPNEMSPTRMAAQVVSGIGFLGAGIIFRHGFTIHGLNTAATLWCSAGVGVLAGSGSVGFAAMATGLVMFANLGLRPLVRWIKRKTRAGMPLMLEYRIVLSCAETQELEIRAIVLAALAQPEIVINSIRKSDTDAAGRVQMEITVTLEDPDETALTKALGPLLADPKVRDLHWEMLSEA